MKDSNLHPRATFGVMIWREGKVLLGKRKGSHGSGEYSFTGGHIEFGESFEECVKRETKEEAGINIKDIKFLSVANIFKHENRQDILVMFTANWESEEAKSDPEEKIGEWNWYDIDNLLSPLFYPSEVLIDSYKTGKNYYDKE